jgi:membrane protein implicated in regulation of membrane protease activity
MPIVGIWFLIAAGLLVVEITTTTFYAVFLAVGAAAAGLVAWLLPDSPTWAYALVAFVVSLAGVVIVRPMLGRRLQRRGAGAITPGVHGGFVGQRALTLDEVGDELHPGHIRLAGETWLAVSETHVAIDPNQSVIVGAVRGTTLVVRPAGESPAQRPEG